MAKRKNTTTAPELSSEIVLFHILPKLPGKSLVRFKSVCKQWRSFLTTRLFANIHLLHHLTAIDSHEKVLFFHKRRRNFQTVDCQDCVLDNPRCYPFAGYASILISSVNGLVCVGIQRKNTDKFSEIIVLWNPLTGEYKTLSKPIDTKCYSREAIAFELYYTCSDDDYKILSITTDRNVYIYSLKSDSWRKLKSTLDYEDRIPYAGDHNLLDEKLHFLRLLNTKRRYIIIRLDLKTEKFIKIVVPCDCAHGRLSLMVVRGCIELTIFKGVLLGNWMIEVCRMDEDGDWTKMVLKWRFMNPLSLKSYGNWIGFMRADICKVDIDNDIEEDLCLPYIVFPRIHIETFVSPNQYIIN